MEGVHIFKSPLLDVVVQKMFNALVNDGKLRDSIMAVHLPVSIDVCDSIE